VGILQLDLSQIEWRAAAWLSQDAVMMHEINSGVDQHNAACTDLMELELTKENRFFAKVLNFRMIYGGTAYGFYMDVNMPNFSQKKWRTIVNGFYEKYWELAEWQERNIAFVFEHGYLQIPTKRLFIFNKDKEDKGVMVYNETKIKNYPVQGLAGGDILPLLVVILRRGLRKYKMKSRYILTVHDSIVFDYKENELKLLINLCNAVMGNLVQSIENYFNISWNVKLAGSIEIGNSYGNLEEV